jgi:hypothetical protein
MGLTIYYSWKTKTDADSARALIRKLHARVSKLPFDDVSQVFECDPPDGRYVFTRRDYDEETRRFKPGSVYLNRKRGDGDTETVAVPALHAIFFMANLKGAETTTIGLASHPPVVVHREDVITKEQRGETRHLNAGATIEFPTRLRGWYSWSNFVKTQYAGNPRYGGPKNFLRAHLSVFRTVELATKLGLKTRIRDDGEYWKHHDKTKLLVSLKEHDELIAGFTGRLTNVIGNAPGAIVAPIKDRPDFEHVEARGDKALRDMHKRKQRKGTGR